MFSSLLEFETQEARNLLQGWPVGKPDIIVSTPAAFLNNIDPQTRRRLDFIRGVKYVVCFFLVALFFSLVIIKLGTIYF